MKRAGVKLKFRKLPFSARIFDFFDAGIMAGIRHGVCHVQQAARELGIDVKDDTITFEARAMAIRRVSAAAADCDEDIRREVQIRWTPEDM